MRPIYLFAIGLLGGVIATVMVQTLDPSRNGDPPPERGNVRISFDEQHLVALTLAVWANRVADGKLTVNVERRGTVLFRFVPLGDTQTVDVRLNPNIVMGKLELAVDGAPTSEANELANNLQVALSERLEQAAGIDELRLTAITTTNRRLGFELDLPE